MTVKKLINLWPSKKPSKKIIPIQQGEHGSHIPVAEIMSLAKLTKSRRIFMPLLTRLQRKVEGMP